MKQSSNRVETSSSRQDTSRPTGAKTMAGKGVNLGLANGHNFIESSGDVKLEQLEKVYKLSPKRWHFLMAITLLSVTSTFANEHATLLSLYVDSLEMELPDYVNLYQSMFFIPLVASFFCAQLMDTYGLKPVVWGCFLLCCLRNTARILLFSPTLPHWRQLRLFYWLLQRGILQLCYATFMTMPLKVSELWFPESERSLAMSFLITAPAFGISGSSIIYPHLITGMDNCHWLKYFNAGALLVAFGGLLAGVRRSEPAEGPPSSRCDLKQRELKASQAAAAAEAASGNRSSLRDGLRSFGQQMRRVCSSKNLMIQMVVVCLFEPITMAIFIVVQDIFNGAGLSNVFTGTFMSFQMLAATAVQLLVASRLKPKPNPLDPYNTRTCKLLLLVKMVTFLAFAFSMIVHELECLANYADFVQSYQWLLLVTSSFAFTVALNCARPYFNEQTAELILGVTTEANVSACQNAFGSIVFNVITFAFVRLRQIDTTGSGGPPHQQGGSSSQGASDRLAGDLLDQLEEVLPEVEPDEGGGRPLYLRSVAMTCCVVIVGSLFYLLKFDSESGARRERMRKQSGRAGQPESASQQQQQVVEIELTKL